MGVQQLESVLLPKGVANLQLSVYPYIRLTNVMGAIQESVNGAVLDSIWGVWRCQRAVTHTLVPTRRPRGGM
jgi:hypothetical protein